MVLVIDDDPSVAPLIRGLLRAGGEGSLDVESAGTLRDGIRILKGTADVGLVLLDLRLPDADGLETIEALRRELSADTPVIAITAAGDRDLATAALRRGADDFLLKTELTPSTVARTIRHALERSGFRASRRDAEAAILATLHRLEVAIEAGRLGVWELEPSSRLLHCSAEHARLMGFPAVEAEIPFDALLTRVHPEDRGLFSRMLLPPGHTDAVERDEFRVILESGHVRFVEVHWRRLRDAEGRPRQVAGVSSDVTERSVASEREIQDQRMNAIGEFAAGIAHDLGNTLLLATTALDGLDDELLSPGGATARDNISLAIDQARELVQSLLALARPDERREAGGHVVELGREVEEFVRFLRRVLPRGIRITVDRGPRPSLVRISPMHLRQVLMNLVLNARNAIESEGTSEGEIEVRVRPGDTDQGLHLLEVLDDGPGVDMDRIDNLFEPFVRSRTDRPGVGLGLAIVRALVLAAGGSVELLNRLDRGAIARVYLRAAEGEAPAVPEPHRAAEIAPAPAAGAARGFVALVDRNDYVRRVVCDGLTEGGVTVREYGTFEALLDDARKGHRPRVVVTNGDEPGGERIDVRLDELRQQVGDDVKVIVMTGQGDVPCAAHLVLQKPFSIITLLREVQGLLAKDEES